MDIAKEKWGGSIVKSLADEVDIPETVQWLPVIVKCLEAQIQDLWGQIVNGRHPWGLAREMGAKLGGKLVEDRRAGE